MQLRSNPLLKYALLGVLVLVVYVGVTLFGKGKPQTPEQPQSAQLTPEQAKALGLGMARCTRESRTGRSVLMVRDSSVSSACW